MTAERNYVYWIASFREARGKSRETWRELSDRVREKIKDGKKYDASYLSGIMNMKTARTTIGYVRAGDNLFHQLPELYNSTSEEWIRRGRVILGEDKEDEPCLHHSEEFDSFIKEAFSNVQTNLGSALGVILKHHAKNESLLNTYGEILTHASDGIRLTSATGEVLFSNPGFSRIFTTQPERDPCDCVEIVMKTKASSHQLFEYDGKWLGAACSPIFNRDGDVIRVITVVRDITTYYKLKKRAEEAQARLTHLAKLTDKMICFLDLEKQVSIHSQHDNGNGEVETLGQLLAYAANNYSGVEDCYSLIMEVYDKREEKRYTVTHKKNNKPADCSFTPVYNEKEFIGVCLMVG